MIIIKLWWSVFADKSKENFIDFEYLHNFANIIKSINDKIILIHWTWNIWHWFVKKYWLNHNNYPKLEEVLNNFFDKIDKVFKDFDRIKYNKLEHIDKINKNIIIWWDINKTKIISSDEIFANISKKYDIKKSYILTDVDWVLDKNQKIIKNINKDNIDKINFWWKEWDVTGGMRNKINFLLESNFPSKIINWKKIDNLKKVLFEWKWVYSEVEIN